MVKSRPKVNQPPLRVEEAFATTGNQSLEVQSESLGRPVTPPAVTKMPNDGPLTRPWGNEGAEAAPVLAELDPREVPAFPLGISQTFASQAFEGSDTREIHPRDTLAAQISSPEDPPLLPTSSDAIASSLSFSPEPASPHKSATDNQLGAKSENKTFELRMPENFYGPAKANGEAALDRISESPASTRTRLDTPAQTKIVAAPATLLHRSESQTTQSSTQNSQSVQLAPQNSISPPPVTPPRGGVVSNAGNQEPPPIESPTALLPVRASEALVPTHRLEQPADLFNPRQPPMAPPAAAPQARLRINRIDIQVVNNMRPAAPSETKAPDVSQMLEKRHLGRVELLL